MQTDRLNLLSGKYKIIKFSVILVLISEVNGTKLQTVVSSRVCCLTC